MRVDWAGNSRSCEDKWWVTSSMNYDAYINQKKNLPAPKRSIQQCQTLMMVMTAQALGQGMPLVSLLMRQKELTISITKASSHTIVPQTQTSEHQSWLPNTGHPRHFKTRGWHVLINGHSTYHHQHWWWDLHRQRSKTLHIKSLFPCQFSLPNLFPSGLYSPHATPLQVAHFCGTLGCGSDPACGLEGLWPSLDFWQAWAGPGLDITREEIEKWWKRLHVTGHQLLK